MKGRSKPGWHLGEDCLGRGHGMQMPCGIYEGYMGNSRK